jgi:TPR repeat protein
VCDPPTRVHLAHGLARLGQLPEEKDDRNAAKDWYLRAAQVGNARAMVDLGELLEEDDPNAAKDWYRNAAQAGYVPAMENLDRLLDELGPSSG